MKRYRSPEVLLSVSFINASNRYQEKNINLLLYKKLQNELILIKDKACGLSTNHEVTVTFIDTSN